MLAVWGKDQSAEIEVCVFANLVDKQIANIGP